MATSISYYNPISPNSSGYFSGDSNGDQQFSQSFTVSAASQVTLAQFVLTKNNPPDSVTPYGTMQAKIYSTYTGTPGIDARPSGSAYAVSDTRSVSSIAEGGYSFYDFTFSGAQSKTLVAGTYLVVLDGSSVNNGTTGNGGNGIYVAKSDTNAGNGSRYSAGSWRTSTSYDTEDLVYDVYGNLLLPHASFTATPLTGVAPLNVTFTDTSTNTPTSWSWDFGDGGTSTSQNPSHSYASPGAYYVNLQATNANGSDTTGAKESIRINVLRVLTPTSVAPASSMGSPTIVQTAPPPPAPTDWTAIGKEDEKVYLYKISKPDGTYVGIWNDVKDVPEFTQRINTPGTTMTVRLARSANTTKEVRARRITEGGDARITEDGSYRTVSYLTSNSVGEDTDVDLSYNVDIYVHYGEFDTRITQDGDTRITEDGDRRVTTTGAPLGVRIFSGYIMDYESIYGREAGVTVTVASNGFELSQEVIRSGSTTTVTYSSTAIEGIFKGILDANPGRMTYSAGSIEPTGTSITANFKLNTKLEGLESAYEQTPNGWYWYGDVGDNFVYLKPISTAYDHTFVIGKHIKELRVTRSIENLVNTVYFVGGDASGAQLYKKYEDTTSQAAWRQGLERITDRRYTLTDSMAKRANKLIGRFKDPVFTSPITISSARFDIESIKLGQTVGFANVGNFIDTLPPLQIVSLSYGATSVTLQLGELLDRQIDIVSDVQDNLSTEQYDTIPSAPS